MTDMELLKENHRLRQERDRALHDLESALSEIQTLQNELAVALTAPSAA